MPKDTCYSGYIKGIGRLYQLTGRYTHANIGFAKVYTDRTSLTAADFLNDKVLPFYDEHGINVLRILTDCGAEYCGRTETHAYELFQHLNGFGDTKTKPRHPQTNGCAKRLNQTVQEKFYKVAFRKKLYQSLEETQADLDVFMAWYSGERANQGRYRQGRTPRHTFLDGLELYQKYVYENPVEEKGDDVNSEVPSPENRL